MSHDSMGPFLFQQSPDLFYLSSVCLILPPKIIVVDDFVFFLGRVIWLSRFLLTQWNSTLGCTLENTKASVPLLKLLITLVWCGTWT